MIEKFNRHFPQIHSSAFVHKSAVIIGQVDIDADTSIWPHVSIRGDINYIKIGKQSNIQENSSLHVTSASKSIPNGHPLIIKDNVTIGHKVILHGCEIGNSTLIGMGSIILDGAMVADKVMLGAGSLVPPYKKLESGFLYLGSPAIKVRRLNETELNFLDQSSINYVELKNDYLI